MTTTAHNPNQTGYKAHCIQRGETFSVSHDRLSLKPGFNERRLFRGIPELADRIRLNGFRKSTPLIVEWNKELQMFEVIHGERRTRAVKLLVEQGHDPGPIWCMSESKETTPLQQLFDQILTNTGEQFTPLEKGRLYLRIQEAHPGITQPQIAETVGETKQAVSVALRLAKHGSPALHFAIEEERISSTTAASILTEAGEDHAAQDRLLQQALASAGQSGSSHVTPKHLPQKEKQTAPPPADQPPFIADLTDEQDPSDPSDPPDQSTPPPADTTSSLAPADPGAIQRIQAAPSTNRDGSSGPGSGKYEAPDKRLKGIEKILDDLDKKGTGHEARITTTEIVLGYLNNERSAKELKDHLLGK